MRIFKGKISIFLVGIIIIIPITHVTEAYAAYRFSNFKAHPPIHIYGQGGKSPMGLTPDTVKNAYSLPKTGGSGTIAIISAYDSKTIEKDLEAFNKEFNLPQCTAKNSCFEKHLMNEKTKTDSGWALETSLDVEWSHAIAPQAKILLVEATTQSGKNLLEAIDYARKRKDVVSISMSWGGAEFQDEIDMDYHFTSDHNITFFASSGDKGAGVSWPAVSPNVVAVGGTTLSVSNDGTFQSETAWNGSGGGIGAYESEPDLQKKYSIPKAKNKRAIPDVSFNADPSTGFSVYHSTGKSKNRWYVIGGTSAGAPQWAAIKALGNSADNEKFYADKSSANQAKFFRDIKSGSNGDCKYYCDARKRYDYVTGLGSPITTIF